MTNLPKLTLIRAAILAAPQRPTAFPFAELRDSETLKRLRTAAHLQAFLNDMRKEAARAKSEPIEQLSFDIFQQFELTGERTSYEHSYFDRRKRLAALALTTLIDESDQYLATLCNLIWEICNEYTWALPAHLQVGVSAIKAYRLPPEQVVDLFAAETAHTLAELLSLLDERIPQWLHYRIRSEIERRIFQPIFYNPHHFEWESASMNWAAVCGACIGMTVLILEDNREKLVGKIDRIIRTMEAFLDGFGADGGCPEGIAYWVYGFGYYSYFAESLYSFTEAKLDLLQGEHIQAIAAFPQAISLGASKFINYSDADENAWIHSGLASYLANRLQIALTSIKAPDFHADPVYRWGHILRDLLWTKAESLEMPAVDGSYYLSDIAWLVERRIYQGKTIAFSAKGGHNDEAHNHNDLGHFIIHLAGESILVDLGAAVYTRQYFRDERYDFLQTGSQGHSVPIINGQKQSAGAAYTARVLNYEKHPNGSLLTLDLTHAYSDSKLLSFLRSFDWNFNPSEGSARLMLSDSFEFSGEPLSFEEYFISLIKPSISDGLIHWQGQAGSITMTFDAKQFDAFVDVIESQNHYHEPLTVYRLRLSSLTHERSQNAAFVIDCTFSPKLPKA